jgi:hypothetical protein
MGSVQQAAVSFRERAVDARKKIVLACSCFLKLKAES